ncbi:hypothetical protein L596_004486 [Steinernema carpocapsae]|uniref:Saposin B-type domain-containing protein n=1 Tax=Steinernema carpocapsae TaxID=34508 RepID=A0A4U8UW28_STECR|nr:hypothetical protein L596_004486 [Steinernema carpocapsae]
MKARDTVGITRNFVNGLQQLRTKKGTILMGCFECKVAIDALLLDLLNPDQTKKLAMDVKAMVCPKMPAAFLVGCNDFLDLYMPTVVMMTLKQFTADDVCKALHSCPADSFVEVVALPKKQMDELHCEACTGITNYLKKEIADADERENLILGIQYYTCAKLPTFVQPFCETFVGRYMTAVLRKIENFLQDENFCTAKMNLC